MGTTLRDFRRTIYKLRKKYGLNIDLYRTSEVSDYKTGNRITTRTKFPIKKGIMLPSAVFRDYNYATLLTGVQPAQYGGIIDTTVRRVIIEKKDLPDGFVLTINDYCIIRHERYSIKEITLMEVIDHYSIILKQVIGQQPFEIHDAIINDYIELDEQLNGEEPTEIEKPLFHEQQRIIDYPYNPFLIYENLEDMEEGQGPG